MTDITREEWKARRAAEQGITEEQLQDYLDRFNLVVVPCDGSCGYDTCEGWIVQMDYAALIGLTVH